MRKIYGNAVRMQRHCVCRILIEDNNSLRWNRHFTLRKQYKFQLNCFYIQAEHMVVEK